MTQPSPQKQALAYLEKLDEETMRLAWSEIPEEDRAKLATAAVIFGRQFQRRVPEGSEPTRENEFQRLLMSLMNDVIEELSRVEGMSKEEATSFLSDVGVRDKVLEMDEVIEAHENSGEDPGKSLDALLREAIEGRQEKAIWSDHWSSG